jgi:predicted nucleotidyltransferase
MDQLQSSSVKKLVDFLLSRQKEILGDNLVGLYLYGSLVTGDFDENVSDVDMLAAMKADVTSEEAEKLKEMHIRLAEGMPEWNDRVEVQYLSLRGLKTFRTESTNIAAISPGESFHIIEGNSDWLVNWYMVREKGLTVLGPPPSSIIDPISQQEFINTIRQHLLWWKDYVRKMPTHPGSQAYTVMTMCRAYYSIIHGEQVSKLKAAKWCEDQFPQWTPLIEKAIVWRQNQHINRSEDAESAPETIKFVAFMLEQMKGK